MCRNGGFMEKKRIIVPLRAFTAVFVLLAMLVMLLPATEVEAASVKLNKTSQTMYVGETLQLKLKNYKKTVTWTSSDEAVASVGKDGAVLANKKGTAVITATTAKGSTFTCKIKVKNPYVNPKSATLIEGETLQLSVVGANPVSYSSNAKSYAKVSKTGLVTAVKARETAVTIKVKCDNGKTYKSKITVVAKEKGNEDSQNTEETKTQEYYGLRNPRPKTDYVENYVCDKLITTDEDMVRYAAEGFTGCAKTITMKFKGKFETDTIGDDDWSSRFYNYYACYSAFRCCSNYYLYSMTYYPSENVTKVTFTPVYKDGWKAIALLKYNDFEADSTVKKLLAKAEEIAGEAVAESSDLRSQLLYINNKLCTMASYDNDAARSRDIVEEKNGVTKVVPAHDATGVLLKGKGVCESYASAYELCLNVLGVDNYVIANSDTRVAHVWNRVKVDGKWLNVDVTWDDDEYSSVYEDYFLLNDEDFKNKTINTGNDINAHSWNTDYLPE